jgi:hypothetical protein
VSVQEGDDGSFDVFRAQQPEKKQFEILSNDKRQEQYLVEKSLYWFFCLAGTFKVLIGMDLNLYKLKYTFKVSLKSQIHFQ